MATDITRIADQLRHAVEGEAWYGPSVLETLSGVDARTAAAHPIRGVHSIWEILHHITAWSRAVLRRTDGQAVRLEGADDWPPVTDTSDAAWQSAIAAFRAAHQDLLAKLNSMSDDQLDRQVPGKKYNHYFQLHGLIQHHLYHAGQIAILKKAGSSSSAPSQR
jgi:uncharacterized damage-inducible protein DinB